MKSIDGDCFFVWWAFPHDVCGGFTTAKTEGVRHKEFKIAPHRIFKTKKKEKQDQMQ